MAAKPIATDDNLAFNETDVISGNLLANDTAGSFLRFFDGVRVNAKGTLDQVTDIVGDYGTFHVKPDGSFTYELSAASKLNFVNGESLVENLTYKISDGSGLTDVGKLSLTINGVTQHPIAVDDTLSFNEGDSIGGNVLANDIPGDNGVLYLRAFNQHAVSSDPSAITDIAGTYGTFHVKADGSFTYDLNSDINTDVTEVVKFYKISDGHGDTDVGQLNLTIHDGALV